MSEKSLRCMMKAISQISKKLDTLTRMIALDLVNDFQVQRDKIVFLSQVGLMNAQIAIIVGTTSHTVKQRLYEARKEFHGKVKNTPSQSEMQTGGEEAK